MRVVSTERVEGKLFYVREDYTRCDICNEISKCFSSPLWLKKGVLICSECLKI